MSVSPCTSQDFRSVEIGRQIGLSIVLEHSSDLAGHVPGQGEAGISPSAKKPTPWISWLVVGDPPMISHRMNAL